MQKSSMLIESQDLLIILFKELLLAKSKRMKFIEVCAIVMCEDGISICSEKDWLKSKII